MALFAPIPSPVMLLAWGAAAVAGLAAVAAALGRRFAPDLSTRSVVVPVVALAPLCFPFAIGLLFGNLDVFFPLLYGAMLLAVAPGTTSASQRAGGLALATASIAKLHPASLGVWFGTRTVGGDRASARALLVAVLVGIALLAVSVVVWGITPWTDYLAVIRAGSNADLVDPRNAGPAAQLALLLGADDRFARTAQIGVTLAVIVVSVVAGRRGGDPVERFGWAAAASLATLPVTWFHYPSAMLPFGLVALLRSHGGPAFGRGPAAGRRRPRRRGRRDRLPAARLARDRSRAGRRPGEPANARPAVTGTLMGHSGRSEARAPWESARRRNHSESWSSISLRRPGVRRDQRRTLTACTTGSSRISTPVPEAWSSRRRSLRC